MESFDIKLQQWACLQPKEGHTGCAIILKEENTHKDLVDKGLSEKSYLVQTDFGNVFKMTEEEVNTSYTVTRIENDPIGRFIRQKELLDDVFEKYYSEI